MPTISRGATAPGWSSVAGTVGGAAPYTGPASSGGQGGIFGDGAGEYLGIIDALMQMGLTPEQAQAAANDPATLAALSGAPEVSMSAPLSDPYRDARANQEQLEAPYRLTPEQQAIEDRFGNDMAWLDPLFQREATTVRPTTTADALQYGTTADPAAQAAQQDLFGDVRSRGLTADPQTAAAQRNYLADLGSRGLTADTGAMGEQRSILDTVRSRGATADTATEGAQRDFLSELRSRGTAADPAAETAQRGLLSRFGQRGTSADPLTVERQENLANKLLYRGPSANAESRGAQGELLSEIGSRGPSANAESRGAQTSLLSEISGRGTTSDADSEEAQRYALEELFGLYRQGGQDAQNRAARARSRADSENWLLGQREADMADLAERGMSGSGAEVLSLLGDRQAAASRLSAADLEADAAAEKRALDALLSGAGLAGNMRAASDQYEGQNTASRSQLASQLREADDTYQAQNTAERTRLATAMRDADDSFANVGAGMLSDLYGSMRSAADAYDTDYAGLEADLASRMRDQADTYQSNLDRTRSGTMEGMRSAADQFTTNSDRTAAGLATDMRSQADDYQEGIDRLTGQTLEGMRNSADNYQVNNDRTAAGLATDMRDASDRFVGGNADRMGDAAEFNARMINDAADAGKQFLQNSYTDTMRRRDAWDRDLLGLQTGVATGTRAFDAGQQSTGYDYGYDVAGSDVTARNAARNNENSAGLGIWTGSAPSIYTAEAGRNNATGAEGAALGNLGLEFAETMASMGAGGGMGGAAGGGAGAFLGGSNQALSGGGQFAPPKQQSLDPWERY